MSRPALRPYQQESLDYLTENKRAILADDPGLGKSRVLLEASEGRTLVVSAAALQDTWAEQHELWRPELDLTWTSYGMLFEREVRTNANGDPWPSKAGNPVYVATPKPKSEYLGFDTVIFDEAHEIKNRDANQSKAALQIAWSAERLYLSTGTPLPNWGHEIYMSLRAMHDKNDKRFTSYWRWANTWFDIAIEKAKKRGGKEHRVVMGLHPLATWERFAQDNGIEGKWIRHERDDVLTDLPPLTQIEHRVPMPDKQRKAYKEFEKDWFTEVDGQELLSWHEGGIWLKLLKLSTGLETEFEGVASSGKLDMMEELLRERTSQQTLVFGWFQATLNAAVERATELTGPGSAVALHGSNKGTHREALRRWREGEIHTLCLSIKMFKEGITLNETDTIIFLEHSAVPSHNEQAMRRAHRLGQTRPVDCHHLWTQGTVDTRLATLLDGKNDQQAKALRAFNLIG